jgi:hypothetical protein
MCACVLVCAYGCVCVCVCAVVNCKLAYLGKVNLKARVTIVKVSVTVFDERAS